MMNFRTPLILILYSFILFGVYLFSRWGTIDPTFPPPHRDGNPVENLDLSEDQRLQLRELRQQLRPEITAKRAIVDKGIIELEDLLRKPDKSEEFLKDLEDKFRKVESDKYEMHQKRFQLILKIRNILNDEQLKQFQGMTGPLRRPRR